MPTLAVALMVCGCSGVGRVAGDGWIDLFNGRDLSGWTQKNGTARYFVEDGCIVGETVVPGRGTNSFLCTDEAFDDFVLEIEFKGDPRLNSGVQFRSAYAAERVSVEWRGETINIGQGYVYGYQAEIEDVVRDQERMWTGGIYDERRRRWLYPGPLGGTAAAFREQGNRIYKFDDWNQLRIEAVGDSIKTYLNGALRAEIRDSLSPRGFIGLQVHASNDASLNGAQVRFRNIRLKRVTAPAP